MVIDIHEDIALNAIYSTSKDISKKHTLHQGISKVGFPVNNNVDIPRLKKGQVKLVFSTIFSIDSLTIEELIKDPSENYNFKKLRKVKTDLAGAIEQYAFYSKLFFDNKDKIQQIRTKKDYRELKKNNKVGILLHSEGTDYFQSVDDLEVFYKFGLRSLALTWRNKNIFGGGNNSGRGLTKLGIELIRKTQQMGVIIDLAHANRKTFYNVLKQIKRPCFVSHTNCNAIHKNSRNITDQQIKAVASKGGVIGIAPITEHMGTNTLDGYLDHIMHVVSLVGAEHVCFGTDFDGMVDPEDKFIKGFEDVSKFGTVLKSLPERGLKKKDVDLISFKNAERVILENLK